MFLIRFKGTVDDPDILNWPAPLKLCGMCLNILQEFKPSLTIMQIMCNDALRPRHWKAMSEIAGFNLMPNAGTTLRKMVEFDLKGKLQEYGIISTCASKEQQLLEQLTSLKVQWKTVNFTIKAKKSTPTLEELNDIETLVEDHAIKLLNMRSSVFVKPYEREVLEFSTTLQRISAFVHDWKVFQSAYMKLLPVFQLKDVCCSIPKQAELFQTCHRFFQEITKKTSETPAVLHHICQTNIVEDTKISLLQLEHVQKGVDAYLEGIRVKCPRLYFISNQETITLMATDWEFCGGSFLWKLFPGVDSLGFGSSKEVIAFKSRQGEEVRLRRPIDLSTVESTFNQLQAAMVDSLQQIAADCFKVYKKLPVRDLVQNYPQQVLQVMARVFWTDQVENALKLSHNIKLLICKQKLESSIEEKIALINSKVNQLERVVLRNLLISDLNNKYLLSSFVKDGLVIDHTHFEWQVQLRYYFQSSLCSVRMLKHSLDYGYEYLGNSEQIVLTPLTDRCFVALLSAYFSSCFGFVRGKIHSGKASTVRALAEALGRLFLSFTCLGSMDAEPLLQLLKGAVQCGAWITLKHFEQLKVEVLSVISQDLLGIIELKKRDHCSAKDCFVVGQLSTGRTGVELPENFKVLFRTFTLTQPELGAVLEGLLASKGVKDCRRYSRLISHCFALLEDALSSERQFSFRLGEAKKLLEIIEEIASANRPEEFCSILCQSLNGAFMPSLNCSDQKIFSQVLWEVFHESAPPAQSFEVDEDINPVSNQDFNRRVSDLFASMQRSRSVILLGRPFTGKTSVLKACARLFKRLNSAEVELHVFNPKCLDYQALIGHGSTDKNVRWIDGVLLRIIRQAGLGASWILLDGCIEESWNKGLSSVVEDGTLCLESLESLKLSESLRFIFETICLKNASPSMVSGSTTIYFPPETLPYTSLLEAWIKACQSHWFLEHRTQIEEIFNWFLPPCLEAFKAPGLDKLCDVPDNILVQNTIAYFQLILDDASLNVNEDPKNLQAWIHATCLQAGVLGFSASLSGESQQKFDEFFKWLWKGQNPSHPYPKGLDRLEVGIPPEGVLLDYCYLYKQRGAWKLWADLLKNEKIELPNFVPTVDSVRCNFLLELHIKYNRRFLLVGPRATGKSLIFKNSFLNRLPEEKFDKALITAGSHLSADFLQKLLHGKLVKKHSGIYAPSANKRFICFLDDLHCCPKSGSTFEQLRQQLDHNQWCDLKSWESASLEATNFMISFSGSGFPKRLLRHFNLFAINQLSEENVSRIFLQNLTQAWKKAALPNDVVNAANLLVGASLQVYNRLGMQMKPTLAKFHYLFDINSLSTVFQGCVLLRKDVYDGNKKIFVRLWAHEVFRVFADRMFFEDVHRLCALIKESVAANFPAEDFQEVLGDLPFNRLFFASFQDRSYDEVKFQLLEEKCLQSLQEYNSRVKPQLDLLLFDYVLEHLARLLRLLAIPNEGAMLIGLPGYGRQSLVKFASFISKREFSQSESAGKFCQHKEEFKSVMRCCGGIGSKWVFFGAGQDELLGIVDHYIRDGDVTDLYEPEEKQELLELSRLAAQGGNRNLEISSHKVFLYFNRKCRENCHVFLSVNLEGLRARLLAYPSLATRLNLILWNDWPESALTFISTQAMRNVHLENGIKERASLAAQHFYQSCQRLELLKGCVTPKAYFHFHELFVGLLEEKQKRLTKKKEKFQQGLAKLSYAASQILNMQQALAEYQPQLEEMTENAVSMTEQIALETLQVEKASALVRKDEKTAKEQAAVAELLKSECESELAQAIPILEDAISALNTLKPSDITLVKSMKNPPDAIKLVMASVCVIKDVKPDRIPDPSTGRKSLDYWGPSKRILGDMNFLQTLKDFDKDHIKPEVMVKIRKDYLPHKDFKPHVVAKASSAAEGLCKWIIAMDMYDRVAKEVAPKKEKLNKAEREYANTMMVLNQKKEEVVRIEEKLAQLHGLLEEATRKQRKLQIEVDICNKKLQSAQKLIGGLSGERLRWTEAAESLQSHYEVLVGDLLLSSGIISYLAPLHKKPRQTTLKEWQRHLQKNNIPLSSDFQFASVLSNDVEVQRWMEFGLPADSFYIENAVIFGNSKLFCLLLDPHAEALQWIANLEACNNLTITEFTFNNWLMTLVFCLTKGKTVLIKDCKGELPTCLHPFLCGQGLMNPLDGQRVEIHHLSRVYIVCCNPKTNYPREITSRLTTIDFSLTFQALEEDVLSTVVAIENPNIRKQSKELTQQNKANKAELKELEAKILSTLCESQADILEDEDSILRLDKSKELTKLAMEKQAKTKQLAELIHEVRSKYSMVAKHAACLFFCISHLSKVHHMYQFSVKWFKNLFFISILNAGKSKDFQTRCQNLCSTFTFDLHQSVIKGIFEKHKLLFTFWLALQVLVNNGDASEEEVALFFQWESLEAATFRGEKPGWIAQPIWLNLLRLESSQLFKGVAQSLIENPSEWRKYCQGMHPPKQFHRLSIVGRIILDQVLKPEETLIQIRALIKSSLGERFLTPIGLDMQQTFSESYNLLPILFILTPGLDVLKILQNFALVKGELHNFHHLSLSEANCFNAEELIEQGRKSGSWILLQNCHYTGEWLFQLDQLLKSMDFENTCENFRLFLTSSDSSEFPLELIQNSIKIVEEPPDSLGRNLLRIYNNPPLIGKGFFYGCPGKQEVFSRLLFALCNFHTLLQQRRKFRNWNVMWRFEEADLGHSLELLRESVNEQICLFEKVYFVIGECIYNGHLGSNHEKSFVLEMLKTCVSEKVLGKNTGQSNGGRIQTLPSKNDRRDYLRHIEGLPEQEAADSLYLTEHQLAEQQLLTIRNFSATGSQMLQTRQPSSRNHKGTFASVDELIELIPANIQKKFVEDFLTRESRMYRRLLERIRADLRHLKLALQGDLELSDSLEDIDLNILQNTVPKAWLKLCYPTLASLAQFVKDLSENVRFLENFTPNTYLVRALFFPRAILAFTKLKYAKEAKVMPENIDFLYKGPMDTDAGEFSEFAAVFNGVFLMGARCDRHCGLVELNPATSYSLLPSIIIQPAVLDEGALTKGLKCGLFKTEPGLENLALPGADNFVSFVKLRCENGSFWAKRAVYLVGEVPSA
ncbi:dynein axonemal heavy chain 7-like [Dendroctonus ponderosae]|uniref:dynein axonemal heavy chain 7-like n=1 Tax=Dendroctonus ponderosae TaxID=77166 RepID=UPI0020351CE7|nr:dynein axonemal heavy chain 7-like [Dendroctonus ponderosae]